MENWNGEYVKETTTLPQSRQQPKATNGSSTPQRQNPVAVPFKKLCTRSVKMNIISGIWCTMVVVCLCNLYVFLVFSSPGPKGQVSFSHHLASVVRLQPASVVVLRLSLTFTKIFSSETTGPNFTKPGHNHYWGI